jgi:hypothetical protein
MLKAKWASSPRRAVLITLVIASLACAPVSWITDGVTPSFIVYPLVLLVGLWRYRRGGGTLFFGIAASIFLLVHRPLRGRPSPTAARTRTRTPLRTTRSSGS